MENGADVKRIDGTIAGYDPGGKAGNRLASKRGHTGFTVKDSVRRRRIPSNDVGSSTSIFGGSQAFGGLIF